tara:strand:- start:132 stop:1271 length:1140 start_codon:yes stop_codon:yes gene_type:complete
MEIINLKKKLILTSILFLSCLLNSQSTDLLSLPDGFEIKVFANGLDSPRQITETEKGYILVGSKKGSEIVALLDQDKDGVSEKKVIVSDGLQNPTGITFFKGDLYFAEIDKVWIIEDIDEWLELDSNSMPKKSIYIENLPSETWHGFKYIDFGPDGNLYIPIGAPCNSDKCLIKKQEDSRYAAIHKYERNKLVSVAEGVRNSVGFDWHPVTKKLYFSDNGRDWLGDNTPSCELNVIDKEGNFFGFPYKHAKNVIDPIHGNLIPNLGIDFIDPIAELGAHVAPLGITFYDHNEFPEKYKNSLFIALHGSWNKYNGKSGYEVIFVKLDSSGNYLYQESFISGWLQNENAWGRPVAPFIMSDGSMLISDDKFNVIYKVQYKG